MKVIVNSLLTACLFSLMVFPLVASYYFISYAPISDAGLVAGIKSIDARDINILPNLKDFNGYVEFNPTQLTEGIYRDDLGVTVFQRQKATYRGIYAIYNMSAGRVFEVEAMLDGVPELQGEYGRIVVTLNNTSNSSELKESVRSGESFVLVEDGSIFHGQAYALIGEELIEVISVNGNSLVVSSLKQNYSAGEGVYPQSIVLAGDRLVSPQTSIVKLNPGERTQLHIEVLGTADMYQKDKMMSLPLKISFKDDVR